MVPFVVRRVLSVVLTLLGIATIVFVLVRLAPGDPAETLAGGFATEDLVRALRQKFSLDRPLHVQYLTYLSAVFSGNFGNSFRTGLPVLPEIAEVLPFTLQLVVASIAISTCVGVTLGTLAAWRRGSWFDTGLMALAVAASSMPAFWVGLLLLLTFAYWWPIFPVLGTAHPAGLIEALQGLVLPALAVGIRQSSLVARMTRTSVLETITQDYVRVAYAKGLRHGAVLLRHVLRNAAVPIVTIIGLEVGYVLGGSLVTEIVFTRPGIGTLLLHAIHARDYPTVQAVVLCWGAMFLLVNLVVDFVYPWLDPRLRLA